MSDYCLKVMDACLFDSTSPLFYYYDFASGKYQFDASDDSALLTQVNSGVNKFTFSPISTNEIFATTTPPKTDLVQTDGKWNLEKAVGGTYIILFEVPSDPLMKEELDKFENLL